MRKKIYAFLFICMLMISLPRVRAAYAYSWYLNGEYLNKGMTNSAGTATWIEDSNYSGGILILNNYDSGKIELSLLGTGMNQVFAIKLVGENKITVDQGIGLRLPDSDDTVEIIGDGSLTINAPITIGSYLGRYKLINKSNVIENKIEETENNIQDNNINDEKLDTDNKVITSNNEESNSDNNETTGKPNDTNNVVKSNNFVTIYCIVSSIIIVILLIILISKKEKAKE